MNIRRKQGPSVFLGFLLRRELLAQTHSLKYVAHLVHAYDVLYASKETFTATTNNENFVQWQETFNEMPDVYSLNQNQIQEYRWGIYHFQLKL